MFLDGREDLLFRLLVCFILVVGVFADILDALYPYWIQNGDLNQELSHFIRNLQELQRMLRLIDFEENQRCHYIDAQYVVDIPRTLLVHLAGNLLCLTDHLERKFELLRLHIHKPNEHEQQDLFLIILVEVYPSIIHQLHQSIQTQSQMMLI